MEDVPSARIPPNCAPGHGESSKVRVHIRRLLPLASGRGNSVPSLVREAGYKQRWYMVGMKERSNDVRTYTPSTA